MSTTLILGVDDDVDDDAGGGGAVPASTKTKKMALSGPHIKPRLIQIFGNLKKADSPFVDSRGCLLKKK
ncbi:MAG: hypothetical protein ACM3JE_01325 [Betaproteobacteria bacterium]